MPGYHGRWEQVAASAGSKVLGVPSVKHHGDWPWAFYVSSACDLRPLSDWYGHKGPTTKTMNLEFFLCREMSFKSAGCELRHSQKKV